MEEELPMNTPREMVAGATAGLAEHLAMFPFDTVKTRMQQNPTVFVRVGQTFRYICANESMSNLYRGWAPTAASAAPAHAAYFGAYETVKRWLNADSAAGFASSAAMATLAHDSVSVPFDVVKQRLQIDSARRYTSARQCFKEIVQQRGVLALFASLPITVVMNVPQVATHWVVYEYAKAALGVQEGELHSTWKYSLSGCMAGACAAAVSTPLDNIKTQIQVSDAVADKGGVARIRAAVRVVTAEYGIRGFTHGLVPRVCYMAPSAAVVMTTYEGVKLLLAPLEGIVPETTVVPR